MRTKLEFNSNKGYFKNIAKKYKQEIEDNIYIATSEIAHQARTNAPVDKGFLRNSIIETVSGLDGEVSVSVHYAPYIEFGTGGLVDVPQGLESYAMQFKGRGIRQVNIPPQPFLYPAWKNESEKLLIKLRQLVDGS